LSKFNSTTALFCDLRSVVPLNITSSIFDPLNDRALVSPSTNLTASIILLLPLPFGPTTAVMPVLNFIEVLSAKDLNPFASMLFKNTIIFYPFLLNNRVYVLLRVVRILFLNAPHLDRFLHFLT